MLVLKSGLFIATAILSILYLLLTGYCVKRLVGLHQLSPVLNTKKLFVMNCTLSSLLRFVSFSSISVLNYFEYDVVVHTASSTDDDKSSTSVFLDKAALVMFDLPDFCFVSAYVLLLIVWSESILESRRHWLRARTFHRLWIMSYVLFNIALYTTQVSLYSLLFVSAVNQNILGNLIYSTLTGINLVVPCMWLCCYLYMSILFSGFPYSSPEARSRLFYFNLLGSYWTLTRLGWGVVALTSVVKGFFGSPDTAPVLYSCVLVGIFVVAEVLPITFGVITLRRWEPQGKPRANTHSNLTSSHTNGSSEATTRYGVWSRLVGNGWSTARSTTNISSVLGRGGKNEDNNNDRGDYHIVHQHDTHYEAEENESTEEERERLQRRLSETSSRSDTLSEVDNIGFKATTFWTLGF